MSTLPVIFVWISVLLITLNLMKRMFTRCFGYKYIVKVKYDTAYVSGVVEECIITAWSVKSAYIKYLNKMVDFDKINITRYEIRSVKDL